MKHIFSLCTLIICINLFAINTLDDANALLKKGNEHFISFEPDEALECFSSIIKQWPNCAEAYHNIGLCLAARYGKHQDAIVAYHMAHKLKPNNQETIFCYALSHLALGDFNTGWKLHESRWLNTKKRTRNLPHPLPNQWHGENVANKRFLIRAEQGLGDVIQFSRYIQLLKQDGAYIIFESPPCLRPLFSLCDWIDEFMGLNGHEPDYDYQCALMSLPYWFNTRPATIPQNIPYLKADETLVDIWKDHFDQNYFNIGICWYGDPVNGSLKYMPLEYFAQLANIPNVRLYSLQQRDGLDQLQNIPKDTITIFDDSFDNDHGSFMDTAAVMQQLDLIITIDTSVAHLAGALGRPTFLILPQPAEWRWELNQKSTPWYPSMQLFRQTHIREWDDVLEAIKRALHPLIMQKIQRSSIMAEISIGELIDKITILRIKNQEIHNEAKLKNIRNELHSLQTTKQLYVPQHSLLDQLEENLLIVNKQLWDIEDAIRDKEYNQEFDSEFIDIARSVYVTNDERCAIKRRINELCGSRLQEEKSYKEYQH